MKWQVGSFYRCQEVITFGSDPIQNGRHINDQLNGTIVLNAENEKS